MKTPLPEAGERLAKRVAQLSGRSRREAEQLIEGGWVQVNGVVVEEPMARVTDQTVVIDPAASPMALTDVTLLLHKPPGLDAMAALGGANRHVKPAQQLLQAATHWAQDPAGQRALKRHLSKLTPAMPLETAASGLVVFTQDWRVLRKLTDDAAFIEHEFLVEVQGEISAEPLHHLNALGVMEKLPPFKASVNSTHEGLTRLRFAVKGAHPGLIAYLCERAGLHMVSMKRLRIGRVTLAHLPEGLWRYLGDGERF
ncbi:MAG: RNA-binding protein [Comamonadaceae bacterium CG1_02_60_18]|nr:MAG: RNA-binding protein [Comamonadaceae bacterium CG1_02_60_18]PIQ53759.1 MAG: RNA-binding protein [Comamonadaceae bacterium CG12_big_fil_rev_8_21_14_0_65_59_15]